MLVCAKIGATHSVVYAGLGVIALRDRFNDATAVHNGAIPDRVPGMSQKSPAAGQWGAWFILKGQAMAEWDEAVDRVPWNR